MKRKFISKPFLFSALLIVGTMPVENAAESTLDSNLSKPMKITVANAGTDNPTLLFGGKPMLKMGPLPEVVPFAVEWGSTVFPHQKWLDWMQKYRLGYGRVYPESGHPWVPYDADKRLIPFEIVRWEEDHPVVDLTRFDNDYWENFARVIQECADRGIVLQMQLYQRVFFQTRDDVATWETNYFHPRNNVNKFPIPKGRNGYTLWNEMVEHVEWRRIHRLWVQRILDAIGDKGNVIIDLMNEGAFKNQVSKTWIEYTLDIIEDWEKRTDNDLLVGMDFDHFYKKNDPGLEYVLSHPRMELIICEGSEGHVLKDLTAGERKPIKEALAAKYRTLYRKPVISTNSPGYSVHENPDALRLYQWCSMMTKVQCAGVYAKTYPINFDEPNVKKYVRQSKVLMEFFDSLKDYIALKPGIVRITQGSGKYCLTLASSEEIVVYLHKGLDGENTLADEQLVLTDFPFKEGEVSVMFLYPTTGRRENKTFTVHKSSLSIVLNEFSEDIVIYILLY